MPESVPYLRPQAAWAYGLGLASLPVQGRGTVEAAMPGDFTFEFPDLVIAGLVLRLAWAFGCAWLERCRRKTLLAIMDKLLTWERKRRQE